MIGASSSINASSTLTLTRTAERSAEQAELRAQQLQRESQRLESEADRTQRNAERLYTRADETDNEARSLLSQAATESGSINVRQSFPTLNPLQERASGSDRAEQAGEPRVPVVIESRAPAANLAAYGDSSNPEPGSLVSERV